MAGAVLVSFSVSELDLIWALLACAVAVASLAALVTVVHRTERRRDTSWAVFVACVVCGATVAFARTADTPQLEPLALKLGDGEIVAGFRVAHTDERIYDRAAAGDGVRQRGDRLRAGDTARRRSSPR